MKKSKYVSSSLNEYIGESKTITLKRKYGERAPVTVGTNAPIRNQVLSYVAESGTISKTDLKKYILGLREGGVSVAAANMFIKRNAKYFVTENVDGTTYFKLSNLGKRLVNRFTKTENVDVSESVKEARESFSKILENVEEDINEQDEEEFEVPGDEEVDVIDDEGPAEEIDYEDETEEIESKAKEVETDQFEYEEDDDKITLTYYKNPEGREEEGEEELEEPEDETREYDFMDKGKPGIYDEGEEEIEESVQEEVVEGMKAQFVIHNLAGKKKSKLGGKLDPKLHNLLDDNQDKDEKEIANFDKEITEEVEDKEEMGDLNEEIRERMKEIIENMKNRESEGEEPVNEEVEEPKEEVNEEVEETTEEVNEAEEPSEADELSDEDLDDIDLEDEEEVDEEEPSLEGEDEVEKVEITEFILTVDDVDQAIEELEELGVGAEKVPIEEPEVEVPAEIEDEEELDLEEPKEEEAPEEAPEEEPKVKESEEAEDTTEEVNEEEEEAKVIEGDQLVEVFSPQSSEANELNDFKKSIKDFVTENYLNEEEEEELPVEGEEDLGSSDELSLGDQGEDAKELEDEDETVEPTEEFEENKIKVNAEDWPTLKGWLEEKGIDVADMFGGEIEMEEIPDDEDIEADEEVPVEIDDEEIDFSGIGEDDDTKVDEEAMYSRTAEARMKDELDDADVEEEEDVEESCNEEEIDEK